MPKENQERRRSRQDDYEVAEPAASHSMLHMSSELVSKFTGSGTSVTRWIQDVEDNGEIFGWSPLQQLLIARRSLCDTAERWLRAERPFKSWEELKTAILKEFPDGLDAKTVHEMMASRKKQHDETCFDYMLIMKEIGRRGKMADYVAIKYIIDGIKDDELNKIMLYGVTTYADLKEKLKVYETVKIKRQGQHRIERNTQKSSDIRAQSQRHVIRCYNCGEMKHAASECPFKEKGLKCFRCNQFGHIGASCPFNGNRRRQAAQATKPEDSRSDDDRRRSGYGSTQRPIVCNDGNTRRYQRDVNSGDQSDAKRTLFGLCKSYDSDKDESELSKSNDKSDVNNTFVEVLHVNKSGKTSKPIKNITLRGFSVKALIDSGSDVNLISSECYDSIGKPKLVPDNITLSGIGLIRVRSLGKCNLDLIIDGKHYQSVFHVVCKKFIPYDVILGQEFLSNVSMVMIDGAVKFLTKDDGWLSCMLSAGCLSDFVIGYMANPELKKKVYQLVQNYGQPTQLKEAPIKLKIVLKDDIPVSCRPRRISLKEQELVEQQVSEWLQNNIIRVSYSEYASPLVLIKKKDGSTRVCVDYRALNRKMVKDEFPLPIIEDLIDKLKDAKIYSVLDLKNGFFHLNVSEESIPYTSFVTHHGQYEFLRAPFGLSICPKYFMRFITFVFRELIAQGIVLIFIDDLLVPAQSEEQAVQRLELVLQVASEYGLEINWRKVKLIQHEVEYLGHMVKSGEVRPSPDKTDAVVRYPVPINTKQVQMFVGLTSYFRKYIKDFSSIAKPLTNLIRKDAIFHFEEEHMTSFNVLKQKLADKPVLKIYNCNLATELHTDASAIAYSAILLQLHDNGWHPVYYHSRATTDPEKKYCSYELEALAIVQAVKKFRHYLHGIQFTIVTDCQAFEQTLKKKDLSPKIARWVLFLDQFDFKIEHRPGSRMRHCDALSRSPCTSVAVNTISTQVREAQERDEGLNAIKEILKENTYQDFWLDNNLLYRGELKQLVIPKSMEKEIIKRAHSKGHFSVKKMKELITKDYYIKDLDRKLQEYVVSCIPCLLATRKAGKQEGFLNSIEKESEPLHTLHIDHIGPMTETKKQYNHILTIVDAFTKFTWIFPVKSTTAKETLDKLKIHQQHFGNPYRIITDKGTAFTNNEFQSYCEEEGIQHITITTGVPRGNGQVERVHRTIIAVLTKMCIENPMLWYRHVSSLQRALNSTYQRSIATTPFELMIGTTLKSKEDVEISQLLREEQATEYNDSREELRKKAKQQIYKLQEENRKSYNKNRKDSSKYKIGELVAIKRTQFGTGLKLKPKYLGPYKVVKIKRNDRYEVVKLHPDDEGPGCTSTAADLMKRWPMT